VVEENGTMLHGRPLEDAGEDKKTPERADLKARMVG